MKTFSVFLFTFVGIYLLVYLIMLLISQKPFKYFFINAFLGVWSFLILELTSFYTGLHIPLNYVTAGITAVCGVPGVVFIEILKYIIFI